MRRTVIAMGCVSLAAAICAAQSASPGGQHHVTVTPDTVKWAPASPALPPGAQAAVLDGDPSQPGKPFALRLKLPDGYRVAAHWHPADENLVVLQGTLLIGVGDKLDEQAFKPLPVGAFARMPAKTNHFAGAKGETIFHLYGVGPFEVTYVNPNDDPRKKGTSAGGR